MLMLKYVNMLTCLFQYHMEAKMRVRDVMTKDLVSLGPLHRLYHALELMRERGIRHVPVLGEGGEAVGIISDRDIKRHMGAGFGSQEETLEDRVLMTRRLEEVMVRDLVVAYPEQSLEEVLAQLLERKVGSALVLSPEDGRLVGLVTDTDLLRCLYALLSRGQDLALGVTRTQLRLASAP